MMYPEDVKVLIRSRVEQANERLRDAGILLNSG